MSRLFGALAGTAIALVAGTGIALAGNEIACPVGPSVCQGTTGDDILTGTSERDDIYADEGNDTLLGRGTGDELRGEEGDDDLDGGKGNDVYYYEGTAWGADHVTGDSAGHEDWLVLFYPAASSLQVDLRPKRGRKEVVLGANSVNFAKDVGIEWVQAGDGADTIKGTAGDNVLQAGDSGDEIFAKDGEKDKIDCGDGTDTVKYDHGLDVLKHCEA